MRATQSVPRPQSSSRCSFMLPTGPRDVCLLGWPEGLGSRALEEIIVFIASGCLARGTSDFPHSQAVAGDETILSLTPGKNKQMKAILEAAELGWKEQQGV